FTDILSSGKEEKALFGAGECDGYVNGNSTRVNLAGISVQTRRKINGDDAQLCTLLTLLVHAAQQGAHTIGKRTRAACAQQGIQNIIGTLDNLLEFLRCIFLRNLSTINSQQLLLPVVGADMSSPLFQVACHNQAIAAIIAGANQHQ